ncbi:hypothetical protein IQ267_19780 [filamentous cyanobacterium LEGE 07170]|nr:hypothetical protein [filamentous cyanobacterium LEGE 07170]
MTKGVSALTCKIPGTLSVKPDEEYEIWSDRKPKKRNKSGDLDAFRLTTHHLQISLDIEAPLGFIAKSFLALVLVNLYM